MSDYKGPRINYTGRNFTTRDNLGIEGVANSIAADLCPIVNTVTPRPFYWAFLTWCYWKYWKAFNTINDDKARKFISRQNFFFALSTLLMNKKPVGGFAGIDNINDRYNLDASFFNYDSTYLQGIGAMGYYLPGLQTMGLVTRQEIKDGVVIKTFKEPHITSPDGTDLAEAFDSIIAETNYCKNYLLSDDVPKDVLVELGKIVDIDFYGFDDCKRLLKKYLFRSEKLIKCKDYLQYIQKEAGVDTNSTEKCRRVFFDEFSLRGKNHQIDDSLKLTAKGWEILTARQYFTLGLEIMWGYMLDRLIEAKTRKEWIEDCLQTQEFSVDINNKLSSYISSQLLDSDEIEKVLSLERKSTSHTLDRGLMIVFSVYNRMKNREDFTSELLEYYDFGRDGSISFNEAFNSIENYKGKSIKEFLTFIMNEYLIDQHLRTAFVKMLENRNGYYIQEEGDRFIASHEFSWGYQANRMVQLYAALEDLGVVKDENS